MIFVMLGTFEAKFERILKELELLDIQDEVVIQSGYTDFKSNKYNVINFMIKDEFERYLDESDLIICHGGVGSILEGINKNKKVIAIPRLEIYKEHVDNHQIEIVDKFTQKGYILSSKNEKDLSELIKKSKEFNFKRYHSDIEKFIEKIDMYIKSI